LFLGLESNEKRKGELIGGIVDWVIMSRNEIRN